MKSNKDKKKQGEKLDENWKRIRKDREEEKKSHEVFDHFLKYTPRPEALGFDLALYK